MIQAKVPAIFLDRDGVIIENRSTYVRSWTDVEIYPQALHALARLKYSPYKVVVVTNQAGVARGVIPLNVAEEINQRLQALVTCEGGRLDRILMCPHGPDDACECRKPRPGLLLRAASELNLDLPGSVLIGDALSDLEAGWAAGIGRVALVRTGRGEQQASDYQQKHGRLSFPVYADLAGALAGLFPSFHV